MKKNQKIILSIISVLVIGIIVTSATFAYWTWVVDADNETEVEFITIGNNVQNELYAKLEGNGTTEVTKLTPTDCKIENAVLKKVEIGYLNKLKQSATITATLRVSEFEVKNAIPTTEELKYLKYALTTTSDSCSTNIVRNDDGEELTGNFSDLVFANGTATNLPTNLFSRTMTIPANMTGEQGVTYYLWIWLDSKYVHINIGDNNTDPMQEISFKVQWTGKIAQNPY